MLPPDLIVPAAPGTVLLKFKFYVCSKAYEGGVLENTVKRPVLCWKLVNGDRPIPIAIALPLDDDDENFVGAEAVIVPNYGVYDPYNGTVWKNADEWCKSVVGSWKIWLKENGPPPPPAPPLKGTLVIQH